MLMFPPQADSVTGEIALLVLESEKSVVQRIIYEPFGNTTAASCLAYLDNDVFFVGSAQGDSQVALLSKAFPFIPLNIQICN